MPDIVSGTIDETVISWVKTGKRGRGAADKALVTIPVEQRAPNCDGRARMAATASTFDFSSYFGHMDLALADGHSYKLAPDDVRAAPQKCRPGSAILRRLCQLTNQGDFTRLALDTSLDGVVVDSGNTELAAYQGA
jgi:hypothetical protein